MAEKKEENTVDSYIENSLLLLRKARNEARKEGGMLFFNQK